MISAAFLISSYLVVPMNQEFNICQHNVLDAVCDDAFIQSGCIYVPSGAQRVCLD